MNKEELTQEANKYAESKKYMFMEHGRASALGYLAGAEPREKRIAELEAQIEKLQKINNEQKETLKKVRVALIQERTANIMNYGKGGVEMFDSMFEILKVGVISVKTAILVPVGIVIGLLIAIGLFGLLRHS